jgi:hypothetical protein
MRQSPRPDTPALAALARIDGRRVAFSEGRQRVFELNDTGAYIWSRLGEGAAVPSVVEELAAAGVERGSAEAWVRGALARWRRLDLLPRDAAARPARVQTLDLCGVSVEIRHGSEALARLAAGPLARLEVPARRPEATLALAEGADGRARLLRGGAPPLDCAPDEVLPALKGQLADEVLARGRYEVALHVASLSLDGRMLLASGRPGAGKTTLALALAVTAEGFALSGDDVALMDHEGRAAGLPLPPAVKAGSWPLLSARGLAVSGFPVHRRPDGRRVRFLPPPEPVAPRPVGWIAFLRRRRSGPAEVVPLDRVEAMRRLLSGAHAPGGRLCPSGFAALARAVGGAACLELRYADLDEGAAALAAACREGTA